MAALESAIASEPIIGWRAWRVYPIDTLRAGTQYRLCAVGTRGVPKVWEPGRATVAVCSAFKSRHEAPDPEHECGLYGLRSRSRLDALLEEWVEMGQGQPVAWAVGQVSLWGRVVELELGWRAEFAYPFAITVYTDDETLARELRQVYAVDVEVAASFKTSPAHLAEEDLRSRLEAIRDGLVEVERTLEASSRCEQTITARSVQHTIVAFLQWGVRKTREGFPLSPRVSGDQGCRHGSPSATRVAVRPAFWRRDSRCITTASARGNGIHRACDIQAHLARPLATHQARSRSARGNRLSG
jgi:hypothetical protein